MQRFLVFGFVLFVTFVIAERVPKGIHVSEESILVSPWILGERAPEDLEISFRIAMRQRNLQKLKEILSEVSNPHSAAYGQYLTREEVQSIVRTSDEDLARIYSWLQESNIDINACEVRNGDVLVCAAPAMQIENIFASQLFTLTSKSNAQKVSITHLNTLSVPSHVSDIVDLVQGLSYIPYRKAIFKEGDDPFQEVSNAFEEFISKSALIRFPEHSEVTSSVPQSATIWDKETSTASCPASASKGCSTANGVSSEFCCPSDSVCCPAVTGGLCCIGGNICCYGECLPATQCAATEDIFVQPETLRDHYSVPKNMRATENYFNQSVVAFTDEYSQGALDNFYGAFNEVSVDVTREGPTGCLPECDQVESDLDMQYMSSMGSGIGLWFWYNAQGYTLEWAQDVLSTSHTPIVYSISYISGEYQLGADYIHRSNAEFVKMGTLGMSVMACSGDTGAPGWSINFPVDPLARNFPFACPDCPTGVNMCNQITATTDNRFCNVPSGMFSRDLERGAACDILFRDSDCQTAFSNFTTAAEAAGCEFSIVSDEENAPRVFSSNCDCSQLPTTTYGSCTISGFSFNKANGAPLTSLYPASSPFATAVGATQFSELTNYLCNQKVHGQTISCDIGEVASSIATGSFITSGGGFSTISIAEPYQNEAVEGYLNSGVPLPTEFFNSSLRAYPDVAFGGHNWLISYSENLTETCPCDFTTVDGTSCASPGFSGLVALLNQELFAAGRSALGFLNPLLYDMAHNAPQTFQDITTGDNYCTEYVCSEEIGYRASVGWDAVTGLGTPHFANILDYLLN